MYAASSYGTSDGRVSSISTTDHRFKTEEIPLTSRGYEEVEIEI